MNGKTIPEDRAVRREESAIALARLVTTNMTLFEPEHINESLSIALWQFTEARGKYTTRYSTPAALEKSAAKVQHEHVIPRKVLRLAILAKPERVESLMRLAVACIVTKAEHQCLSAAHFGWERYRQVGVTVVDRQTGALADLAKMAESLASDWEQLMAPDYWARRHVAGICQNG